MITKTPFDEYNGKQVFLYTLSNDRISASFWNLGCILNSLVVDGVDRVLGFNTVNDYIASNSYVGATVGRVCNRIKNGTFKLNGERYVLTKNEGNNTLHGGKEGFDKKFFSVKEGDDSLTFSYLSPDGEEGFPGNLLFTVVVTLRFNTLLIEYSALSDKATVWCPTSHAYFNLDGKADALNNLLAVYSDYYTPTDSELIPTGKKEQVKGTPYDLNTLKPLRDCVFADENLKKSGYDDNFLLRSSRAARLKSSVDGLTLDVFTDLPALQLYTSGGLNYPYGKSGEYKPFYGICLEPQYVPNAVNMSGFDSPIIYAGEKRTHFIRYNFTFKHKK